MGEKSRNKKDIVFIILHYMAVDVTIESVEHIIQNVDTDSYQIIVVDNHSPDTSFRTLRDKYEDNCAVDLIHNEKNLGFTKGNNVGIRYARMHYDCDYMAVLNNDAFLLDTALHYKLCKYFKRYRFAVAGPRIIDRYGTCGNPPAQGLPSEKRVRRIIDGVEKQLRLNRYHLMMPYITLKRQKSRLYRTMQAFLGKEERQTAVNEVKINVVLAGCFWVFSRIYFEHFDGLPEKKGTFAEEETLLYQLLKKGLRALYMPDVLAVHLEDVSTDTAYRKEKEKILFLYQKRAETWKEYLDMVHREGNQKENEK